MQYFRKKTIKLPQVIFKQNFCQEQDRASHDFMKGPLKWIKEKPNKCLGGNFFLVEEAEGPKLEGKEEISIMVWFEKS